MRRNQKFPIGASKSNSPSNQLVSIDKLVQGVIDSNRTEFSARNIVIETDLAHVNVVADSQLIQLAFGSLINHAQELMTEGGEISITLIDGNHQWELEVADNAEQFPASQEELDFKFLESGSTKNDLPTILPFPASEHLMRAYRAASTHGGQLQTWSCPQGGTAHVLVIPKRARNVAA